MALEWAGIAVMRNFLNRAKSKEKALKTDSRTLVQSSTEATDDAKALVPAIMAPQSDDHGYGLQLLTNENVTKTDVE